MKVEMYGEKLDVHFARYADNDRIAIQLVDEIGMPFATATVNVPELDLAEDVVAVKNYSENTGMLEALMRAEVTDEVIGYVTQGHVHIPLCRLSEETLKAI